MKGLSTKKWWIACLICVLLLGFSLLELSLKSNQTIDSSESPAAKRINRLYHAFEIDEKMNSHGLSQVSSSPTPLIGKSLFSLVSERKRKPKLERRILITDKEDYEVDVEKIYTLFYPYPKTLPNPLQNQVNEIREELYANPPVSRKQELREQLKRLFKNVEFKPIVQEVTLHSVGGSGKGYEHGHSHDGHVHHSHDGHAHSHTH